MSTSATRKRKQRERDHLGLRVGRPEYDREAVHAWLIAEWGLTQAQLEHAEDTGDWRLVDALIARVLNAWAHSD